MTLRLLVLSVCLASGARAETPKLVVLSLSAPKELAESTVTGLNDAIAEAAGRKGYFSVLSSHDVQVMLGVERQKQLIGCSEESNSCLTELSGALGARFVLSGSLSQIGPSWQLSLQMQDMQKSQTVGRATRIAKDVASLRTLLPWVVAEATGTPFPPAPSKWLQISLIAAGGLLAVGSAYTGVRALEDQAVLQAELGRGFTVPGILAPVSYYQDQENSLKWRKAGSLVGLGLGAAMVAAGIYLWPPDPLRGSSLALFPTLDGAVLVGTF